MYTFVGLLGLGFGLVLLVVVGFGVVRRAFPFRPRKGWTDPPPGSQHSGPNRVSRSDEPELFWWMAALLFGCGVAATAAGAVTLVAGYAGPH